jgi:hypothetical protein
MGKQNEPHMGEPSGQEPHMGETEEPEGFDKRRGTEDTGADTDDTTKPRTRPTDSGDTPPTTENM